ncbi:MAG: NUDIX hydrolase [Gammaproteobacteria bacterium]|nr:NUDIX hydrolase [Gammaproteobacteria bacterium]
MTHNTKGSSENYIQKTELGYDGFFKVKRHTIQYPKFSGEPSKIHNREVLVREPTVGALVFDPVNKKVLFTEQFRIGALEAKDEPWVFELPAGIVEQGEDPKTAIQRELIEETGYQVNDLEFIGQFYLSPGGTSEKSTIYYAEADLSHDGVHGATGENEDIKTHCIDLKTALGWIGTKTISASAAIGLLWLASKNK